MIARLLLIFTLGSLLLDQAAHAQYELKAGNFNTTFVAQDAAGEAAPPSGPPNAAGRTPDLSTATAGNYAGMGQVAATAGPLSNTTVYVDRYPSTPDNTVVLLRVSMGGVFSSGVPRYSMGDVISPPLVQADGVTPASSTYWRGQPVLPGETISSLSHVLSVTVLTSAADSPTVTVASVPAALVVNATLLGRTVTGISGTTITLNGNANQAIEAATDVKFATPGLAGQLLFPLGTVNVTSAATNSTRIVVASVPAALVPGATLLGQPVTKISGNDVTLAANANATISSSTVCPITPATSFYYSPHAEKAYASQPGRVTVTWVTRLADVNGNYFTKSEDFAVSANTSLAVRTIFWTEGAFDGPKVQVTDGRITTVNAAYYSVVPKAVADEVSIPGYNPPSPNLTTLSFDKFNGIGQIHAYNVEGRVFIEYLGNVRLAGNIYESIGTDVVDLIRVPPVVYHTVNLGTEILPHNGDPVLTPSPVLSTAQNAATYYGTSVRPDGTASYTAERETGQPNNPDNGEPASTDAYNKVVFYWLEEADFSIKWPKFQDRYWLRWSPTLSDYAHYTVDASGSTPATGVPFVGSSLPQIVYQDDLAQAEAQMDLATQRLFVTFNAGNVLKRNRSLLKFTNSDKVWYVNLYTQAENRQESQASTSVTTVMTTVTVASTAGLTAGMTVTGPGITGTATILSIIDATHYVLSQDIASATSALSYGNPTELSATSDTNLTTTIQVPSTAGLTAGMSVNSAAIPGTATIDSIVDATHLVLAGVTFAQGSSMAVLSGSTNPFFNNSGVWQVNGSATTATAVIESPILKVTTPGQVTLDMLHSYNFEPNGPSAGYDGGRILISRNGSAYTPVSVSGQLPVAAFGDALGWTGSASNVTSNVVLFAGGVVGDTYRFRLEAKWDEIIAQPNPNWSIASMVLNNGAILYMLPDGTHSLSYAGTVLNSLSSTTTATVTVSSTAALSAGMVVTGPGITGMVTIASITDATHLELSEAIPYGTRTLTFTRLLNSTSQTTFSPTIVTVASTYNLEKGMTITGSGINGTATIARIIDGTHLELAQTGPLTPFVSNPSFELNSVPGYPGYVSSPTAISGWTCVGTGGFGLNNSSGPFADNGAIPDGSKVAFIQNAGSLDTTVSGLTSGWTYSLSLSVNSRSSGTSPASLKISVNGASLFTGTITAGAYQTHTVTFTATAPTASLKVENLENAGDDTLLIDYVRISPPTPVWTYTVQSDGAAAIDTLATVGSRLEPPADHENAGYIPSTSGTNYYPAGYLNPFTVGVEAANLGAIIPVNALPSNRVLKVRWFRKVPAPNAAFQDLYVPGKWGTYTVSYPTTTTPQIVIAQGVGTDDLPPAQANGSVYCQNNSAQPGYNPNEEHALMLGGRAYALREDLNVYPTGANYTEGKYTSEPFVLVAYTDPTDHRPAIHAYKVVRTDATYAFDYTATAGTLLVKPYPLPLMPLALLPTLDAAGHRVSKDLETIGVPDAPANGTVTDDTDYAKFTFKDRKGFTWVHRGPHNGGSPTLAMKLYYLSRPGFFIPGSPGTGVPPEGTVLPFLRHAARSGQPLDITKINARPDGTAGDVDEPLTIVYRPAWPTAAPELRVGETLTLPKFGLPQVRGQASAEVVYQQSIANAATSTLLTKKSVTLHDPTREKTVALDAAGVGLTKLPPVIATASYQGKTYFQTLPPHLQKRFYFDPVRGLKGTLVFTGTFHDEIAGEDYLDLNLLTAAETLLLKGLVLAGDDKVKWDAAIEALKTQVETFVPDTAKIGAYKVDGTAGVTKDVYATGGTVASPRDPLAVITNPNTAVDSYAITATGQGTGFVTMVFGNGNAFTPEGDPVQIQVFKIADQLYVGDLKVITSSNPLDEQVTLRHSGDFAGKPEDYEFEWRWATGAASAPQTYATTMTKRLGDPEAAVPSHNWRVVSDPGSLRPSAAQYEAVGVATSFTPARTVNVHPVQYVLDVQGQPTSTVIQATSYTEAEIAAGYPALFLKSTTGVDFGPEASPQGIPDRIVFSAQLGSLDGFVLYVNGRVALAYNAPTPQFILTNASAGLTTTGLSKQFNVAPSYFSAGPNVIEVAVYTGADPNAQSPLGFLLEAAQETDQVIAGTVWQDPQDVAHANTNTAIVGGSPSNPFGGPQFVLNDRWFTMRYKPKASANNVLGTPYSRWMPPQFVEGWIKRVLAAINPFEQRVKDLYNNQVSTDVSVITQAGTRWEGDVALTLDNINDVGLIAIYETVLNRGRNMSIDANTNDPDTNNALILAAGYLNDLYTLLGNEAYADAANPTISLDDQTSITEVNTSRFSFESQVASSLDEELALLRGRDDLVSPGVNVAPAYNRLFWNYTHGINSGEAIYAVNYNIKEKIGSSTANGVIDEADAQRMFPQGHGDAYGHYLTSLTGYYRLLTNTNFTWTPRAEAVTVLGQPVTVDFQDERKFAAAAGNVARTAQQVVALAYRQSYQDDPGAGWEHYHDSKPENPATNVKSAQGLDEWTSRSTQGALFNWAVANALVPDVDTYHNGVQKIDRTTVPEIQELAAAAVTFQTTIDNANAHLNPLGLSPGAIAFDLSPTLLIPSGDTMGGMSHFEQIYARSLASLVNASGAFNQAATMTRSLRDQTNQLDDYNTVIVQQEKAYVNQLIDIYGRPYSGEIGAGKLYAQGYAGPDLTHWYIVDRPNDLVGTSNTFSITIQEPVEDAWFTGNSTADILNGFGTNAHVTSKTVTVHPSQWVQYNDVWKTGGLGSRAETGDLQNALQDAQQSWLAIKEADVRFRKDNAQLVRSIALFKDLVATHANSLSELNSKQSEILKIEGLVRDLEITAQVTDDLASASLDMANAVKEFYPKVLGLASDATSNIRGSTMLIGVITWSAIKATAIATQAAARYQQTNITSKEQQLEYNVQRLGFSHEEAQLAYELDNIYREVVTHATELMQLTLTHQRALQQVQNVLAKGDRILAEREVFRQRAAAIIQGYRTKDLGFRIFRNEALEQYRSLFDLASRYTYLAAKSYDYETGLLGTTQGQTVFAKIVASRSLGDLTGGVPQSTTSTLGDAGLAGTMALLNADFSVAKGRLGINNPDQYGTVFSLRAELYRIRTDQAIIADDDAWRQTMEQHMVANVMTDADVATYCRNIRKPDGTPVPGIVIPFSTTIQHAKNFFGLEYLPGDHNYTPSSYATKIYNVGIALPGYVGMDAYATGTPTSGAPASGDPNALGATPYAYLIPCGNDYMLAPPLGDTNTVRSWAVHDQALPLPYNLGANDFNSTQFFNANGTLSEQPWIIRKHQAFRMVSDASFFYGSVPVEFTNSRLIGRSVWNGMWKIVIPAYTLHSNEQEGLNRFAASVKDIQLFLRTYSHSGN